MIRYIPVSFKMKDFLSVAVASDTDGYPIVDVSPGFLRLTGYSKDQVIGQNCRFLQGEDTDPEARRHIRDALNHKKNFSGFILNYKQSGEPFWQYLNISYHGTGSGCGFFIGVQSAFGLFSEDFFDIAVVGDTIKVYVQPSLELKHRELIFTLDANTLCDFKR